MESIDIITGYLPGVIGRITELHGAYYAENWGLEKYFEAKVATELAAFYTSFVPERDGAWLARAGKTIVGGIFIDGSQAVGEGARLRWFILDPACHGQGIGSRLMSEAVAFCQRKNYHRVYLTTFAGLESARHLYDKYGFRVCAEEDGSHLTGKASLVEQVMERLLPHQPI